MDEVLGHLLYIIAHEMANSIFISIKNKFLLKSLVKLGENICKRHIW